MTTLTTIDLRKNLGDVLNRVYYGAERFTILRKGEPLAAIISVEELERFERLEAERDAALLAMAKAAGDDFVPFSALVDKYETTYGEPLELAE